MSRICKKCGLELDESLFPITGKGYLAYSCKVCTAQYKKQRKASDPERTALKNKEWREANRAKVVARAKEHYKAKIAVDPQQLEKRAEYNARWYKKNKEHCIERSIKYAKCRREIDPVFRMQTNLHSYLSHTVKAKGAIKYKLLHQMLSCTWNQLEIHLESQFLPDMTWNNYGKWHVDHIRPLASFNLKDAEQLALAWHYTNLQPLWGIDNLKKSSRYNVS